MIYFEDTLDFQLHESSAVTLGKFEGVHKGHQKLMSSVRHHAERLGLCSAVFVINPRTEDRILTTQEQKDVIADMGFDALINCPFVPEISHMSPKDFMTEILVKKLKAVYIAVGSDFRFGVNRSGDAAYLVETGRQLGIQVDVIEKEMFHGREISSSYIREAIAAGDMPLVSKLMARDFSLKGSVVHGKHLGTKMGMPTANLMPPDGKILPPDGVYFSHVILDGMIYNALTDIGCRPTVNGTFRSVESYIYGIDHDLYDCELEVRLLKSHRGDIRFETIELLREQLHRDVLSGRQYFGME